MSDFMEEIRVFREAYTNDKEVIADICKNAHRLGIRARARNAFGREYTSEEYPILCTYADMPCRPLGERELTIKRYAATMDVQTHRLGRPPKGVESFAETTTTLDPNDIKLVLTVLASLGCLTAIAVLEDCGWALPPPLKRRCIQRSLIRKS